MAHHFLLGYMNTTSPIIKGFKDGESLLADMAGENGGEGKVRSMVTNNTVGFNWYSQSGQMASQLQSFDPANSEIYNLSSGMEMMVGFPIKNMVVGGGAWVEEVEEDEQSLRRVVSTNNEMAINTQQKGISLSLSSSNNPIGFHSFDDGLRFLGKQENLSHPFASEDQFFHVRSSKYLGPAQELLKEFCCVGTTQSHHYPSNRNAQWQDNNGSSQNHSLLGSLDFLELQKRKSKLFHLLDEVDRGYKHYRDQMTAVVLSFEAVAGNGAAMVYSAMAARVMSRHFRRLKDAILAQVKETKKAMTEKETMAGPGATKGETPRLKIIDQTLRQQKAFQQLTMMDSHPWRPQRGLPERSVSVLRAWLFEHFLHPYPSDVDKHILARQTGLSRSQVSNWFINARVRLWKPMVEEMYLEEVKEHDNIPGSSEGAGRERLDKKPNLVRLDNYSECISSILNIPEKNQPRAAGGDHHHRHFGAVELDFSSYTGGEKKTGGGVSLSLGLPQHGGSGVGLAFTSTSSNSLFYPREQIEECQTVQYTVLENEGQNLPYRNLMGSQLLHDLAG